MNRKTELQARLGPWAMLGPDVDLDCFSDEQWQRLLTQADFRAKENQMWFKIGIARAINEMKAKDADGNPRWPSRDALITHLSKIDEPNR